MSISAELSLAALLMEKGWVSHAINMLHEIKKQPLDAAQSHMVEELAAQTGTQPRNLSLHSFPIAMYGDRMLSSLHFTELEDRELKKIAFKHGVDYIDIETSSQCNRRCHYCTNSTLDRISNNRFLTPATLKKVLEELAEIDYDKELHFVGYNEPLMHRESIVESVRLATQLLPNAKRVIFTNGDYLNREYLLELIDAGVSKLNISVHLAPGAPYNEGAILDRIFRMAKKLQLVPVLTNFSKDVEIYFQLVGTAIEINIFQRDYSNVGHDRGGLLHLNDEKKHVRTAACSNPLKQFIVGYKGTVLPCCALVGDDDRHQSCIVGDASQESIFDIYTGKQFIGWRKAMLSLEEKKGVCSTCNAECGTFENTDANRYELISSALTNLSAAQK